MHRGIEQADNIAVDAQGFRDPDRRSETACDAFRDTGFSVTRFTEQEHAATRVNGGPQPVEHPFVDDQIGKCAVEIFFRGMLLGDALCRHRLQIIIKRDGGRPEIGTFGNVPPGAIAAVVSQQVLIVTHRRGTLEHDQLFVLQGFQDRFHQHEGQTDL